MNPHSKIDPHTNMDSHTDIDPYSDMGHMPIHIDIELKCVDAMWKSWPTRAHINMKVIHGWGKHIHYMDINIKQRHEGHGYKCPM